MSVLYAFIAALLICDLLEMDFASMSKRDRLIELALIAIGIFACGWGIAFDLYP